VANDDALRRSGGTGLVNTEVTDRWYWIVIGALFCTEVKGLGFRDASAAR
jgi:hypothetical protein